MVWSLLWFFLASLLNCFCSASSSSLLTVRGKTRRPTGKACEVRSHRDRCIGQANWPPAHEAHAYGEASRRV